MLNIMDMDILMVNYSSVTKHVITFMDLCDNIEIAVTAITGAFVIFFWDDKL